MLTDGDKVSEIIAHFIGQFDLAVEEFRAHRSYESFDIRRVREAEPQEYTSSDLLFVRNFEPELFDPAVSHTPGQMQMRGSVAGSIEGVKLPRIEPPGAPSAVTPAEMRFRPESDQVNIDPVLQVRLGPPPGDVVLHSVQRIKLLDDDVAILPPIDASINYHFGRVQKFEDLVSKALDVSNPLIIAEPFTQADQVDMFFAGFGELSQAAIHSGGESIFAISSGVEGVYLDGRSIDELPRLDEFLPAHLRQNQTGHEDAAPEANSAVASVTVDTGPEISVQTGGNLLANDATLSSAGVTSTFLAVMGNVHQLDVIVQTNAYSDIDVIGSSFEPSATSAGTTTANVAAFISTTVDLGGNAAAQNPGVYPNNWQVSVAEGDVVFMDWLYQYTFVSDSDLSVVSATGSSTTLATGNNIDLNGVSFANLGLYYDLIIIGGNLYDGNYICQTNVLFDDDAIEMLAQPTDLEAISSVSTGGNLLWNSAVIHNVGPAAWQHGIPGSYADAAQSIREQSYQMPEGLQGDPQLEGFGALRVLYVEGNVYDLHVVRQVNVAGDADYVGLYQQEILSRSPQSEWSLSTGSNALLNAATIQDYDSVGAVAHVGGDLYSEALLIQADIIDTSPNVIDAQSDSLASEVIAFLGTDGASSWAEETGYGGPIQAPADGPSLDAMQTMVA